MLVIEFSCDLPILLSDMYTREMTSEKKICLHKMLHENSMLHVTSKQHY